MARRHPLRLHFERRDSLRCNSLFPGLLLATSFRGGNSLRLLANLPFVKFPVGEGLLPWRSPQGLQAEVPMLQRTSPPVRRHSSRVETPEGIWVYWQCPEWSDTLQVRNLSFGGLSLKTGKPVAVGATARIDFLVEDGRIRTEAVVRHVEPGCGPGLKFIAVADEDRPNLARLMSRLHAFHNQNSSPAPFGGPPRAP